MAHIKFFVGFAWNNKKEEWYNTYCKICKNRRHSSSLIFQGLKNNVKKQNDLFHSFPLYEHIALM